VFMDHDRLVGFGQQLTGERGGLPCLASTVFGRDHVSLKYHEPMTLSTRPSQFRNLCQTSGRHIAITRIMGNLSEVATSRRKCTFWCKSTVSGGWDGKAVTLPDTGFEGDSYYKLTCQHS
jgi:hypothetical protein